MQMGGKEKRQEEATIGKKVELKWNQKKTMCDTFTVLFGLIFFCAMLCMYAHPACFFSLHLSIEHVQARTRLIF